MTRDLQIIRIDPDSRIVGIELVNPSRLIDGIFFLIQVVAMELYQTPGTQVLNLSNGAGIDQVLSILPTDDEILSARIDLTIVIDQVAERIRRRQANETLTSDERLRELTVGEVIFDRENGTWKVELFLTAESGRQTRFDVAEVVFRGGA
jgi:hypothetical protein